MYTKHLQWRVDQWLLFAVIRQKFLPFHLNIVNRLFSLQYDIENFIFTSCYRLWSFIFTQKYAFADRCCFVTFSFEGKSRKYDISAKRKHTKTNKNMIFSVLFTNFCKTRIIFFMQWSLFSTLFVKSFKASIKSWINILKST